jgi:hypothetical protein
MRRLSVNVNASGLPLSAFCEVVVAGGIGNCVRGGVFPEGVFSVSGGRSAHALAASRHSRPHVAVSNRRLRLQTRKKAKGI